jgi:hypothetical protein
MVNSTITKAIGPEDAAQANANNAEELAERAEVITNPNAIVDGMTSVQGSERWLMALDNTPLGPPDAHGPVDGFNDPNGKVAAALNGPHAKMYFITAVPASDSASRTFNVHHGQDVFLPIVGVTDSEGLGIAPTIQGPGAPDFGASGQPSFADEVREVLAATQFSNVTMTLDGKAVPNLREASTGIFSAGIVQPNSAAADFFGATPGVALDTTGQEGFFAVLKDLGAGKHTIVTSFTESQFGHTLSGQHTNVINVT